MNLRTRRPDEEASYEDPRISGPLALPGKYTVTLIKEIDGKPSDLTSPVAFNVVPLEMAAFAAKDKAATLAFNQKVSRLQRAVEGTLRAAGEIQTRLDHLRKAITQTPGASPDLLAEVRSLDQRLHALQTQLRGDPSLAKREEPMPPSIAQRVQSIVGTQWRVTSAPTQTHRDAYRYAGEAFEKTLADFRTLADRDLPAFESKLEAAGAPWTPGRIPQWKMERE
ncbi:MAG: hypothetical protein HYY23_03400 [Verrucomicrobia bacterium]|nr:hypothetical protein [Verrucomicrobiota bacterium]